MIYLDYAANTPVNDDTLQTFCEVSRDYIANPNSPHPLGISAKNRLDEATNQIAGLLNVGANEIIYTSGASEANNLAIKGIALQYKKYGRHMITTYLEHSSVNGPMAYLQNLGYEIDYVNISETGLVDTGHLKRLLREDTILVSICSVDSELGIRQNIAEIARILAEYPHCFFHVDATQAIGKIPVSLKKIDLLSFAPHKFYGLNGCGVLIKKEQVLLEPQIHGGISTTPFRSGTPALALIASTAKALTLAISQLDNRYLYVEVLNKQLRAGLMKCPTVKVNSTEYSTPYIVNISILRVKAELVQQELALHEIIVATKSACCAPNTVSRPVYALTKDKKAALSTLRISLSHLTTSSEVETFLNCFNDCCNKLC